jgi:hypothetical protein
MEYGIQPFSKINGAFVWRFSDLEAAKAQALKLAEEHHTEVMVFQIVGTFKPTTIWVRCGA